MATRPRATPQSQGYANGATDAIERARADILKRQEQEAQRLAEEEFLRNSLRGSDRMRALESAQRIRGGSGRKPAAGPYPSIQGHENVAFKSDEDNLPRPKPRGVVDQDLAGLISQLCRAANESPDEASWMQQFLSSGEFQRAVRLHQTLQRVLLRAEATTQSSVPVVRNASGLSQSLEFTARQLSHSGTAGSFTHQLAELSRLLSRVEFASLLWSHDELATKWHPIWIQQVAGWRQRLPPPDTALLAAVRPMGDRDPYSAPKKTATPLTPAGPSPQPARNQQTFSTRDGIRIKTVTLEKGEDPLGATVKNEGQAVIIGRIIAGGLAYKTGFLQEGDELLSINGQSVYGQTVDEVSDLMSRIQGTVKFILKPADTFTEDVKKRKTSLHVRALFTYNPSDDLFIPCPEMGLTFEKGDIIHIINTTDAHWWQGYLEESSIGNIVASDFSPASQSFNRDRDDDSAEAGFGGLRRLAHLVPSPDFQRFREGIQRRHLAANNPAVAQDRDVTQRLIQEYDLPEMGGAVPLRAVALVGTLSLTNGATNSAAGARGQRNSAPSAGGSKLGVCCRKRRGDGKKPGGRDRYYPNEHEVSSDEDIPTYERVELYYPQPARKRPIVLVGPTLMGRGELVKRLAQKDSDRFATVQPHTTSSGESGGRMQSQMYTVVSRQEFERMLSMNQMIEWGEYEGQLYGISKQAVFDIIQQGKVCLLSLATTSLKALRATNYLPYVVFLSPTPAITQLRRLVRELIPPSSSSSSTFASRGVSVGATSTSTGSDSQALTDDQLLQICDAARRMETRYGHLFDHVMLHENLDQSTATLMGIADRLETEPQWVFREWLIARSTSSPLSPTSMLMHSPNTNSTSMDYPRGRVITAQ